MKSYRIIFLLSALLLTGCNVKVFVTGGGQIEAIEPTAPSNCDLSKFCFDIPFASPLTLKAIPEAGYRFAGWGGRCSEQTEATCRLSVRGDLNVQATFHLESSELTAKPLMQPNTEYFFTAPWPNDAYSLTAAGTINTKKFPFVASSKINAKLTSLAERTKGFGLNSAIYFQWDRTTAITEATIEYINEVNWDSRPAFIINIDTNSADYGHITPTFSYPYDDASGNLAAQALWAVVPQPGYPLLPKTKYAAILYNTATVELLNWTKADLIEQLEDAYDSRLGFTESLFEKLKLQKETLWKVMNEETEFDPENVLAFTEFTTQDPFKMDRVLGATVASYSDEDVKALVTSTQKLGSTCEISEAPQQFVLETQLPNFLAGNGLHLFDGGKIDVKDGLAVPQGITTANVLVTVPCGQPPGTGYPLIAHGHYTGGQWDETDNYQYRNAIHLWLNPPESAERRTASTDSIIKLINLLIGSDASELVDYLVDFNFLNLDSAINRHHQYATDLHFTLRLGKLLPEIIAEHALYEDTERYHYNPEAVALSGQSLGGIAAIHAMSQGADANIISTMSTPRPSYTHLKSVLEWLDDNYSKIIADYTGLDKSQSGQPQLQLLQAVLEPMDTINHIANLEGKNIYWALAEHWDLIHGGDSAYSVSTTLEIKYGMVPLFVDQDHYDFYGTPLKDWITNPPVFKEYIFPSPLVKPVQIITTLTDRYGYYETTGVGMRCFASGISKGEAFSLERALSSNWANNSCD